MEPTEEVEDSDPTEESERFCLKKVCFDLKKNPDLIAQIKSTKGLKYYGAGEYNESIDGYSVEIPIGENSRITFIPGKNVVIGQ